VLVQSPLSSREHTHNTHTQQKKVDQILLLPCCNFPFYSARGKILILLPSERRYSLMLTRVRSTFSFFFPRLLLSLLNGRLALPELRSSYDCKIISEFIVFARVRAVNGQDTIMSF
jgi:hypothetical protein